MKAKDSKVEDTVIYKIDDNDEDLEDNETNNLCSNSGKKNSTKSKPSVEKSWNVPVNIPERKDVVDTENDTAKRDKEEPKPPNKFKSLSKTVNDSITTLKAEPKDNNVVKFSGRKDDKKTVRNISENDVTIVTKVLEFLTGSDPSEATLGSLVRFMWNPGNNSSICWIQGQIA